MQALMSLDYAQVRPNETTVAATTPHKVINSMMLLNTWLLFSWVFENEVSFGVVIGVIMTVPLKLYLCDSDHNYPSLCDLRQRLIKATYVLAVYFSPFRM